MRAWWDPYEEKVIAIEGEDGSTYEVFPEPKDTQHLIWLVIEDNIPPEYREDWQDLLGPAIYERDLEDTNKIIRSYPHAKIEPDTIRALYRRQISEILGSYLARTDWYVVSEYETGDPIPARIKTDRQVLRERAQESYDKVDNLTEEEIFLVRSQDIFGHVVPAEIRYPELDLNDL